MKKRISPMTFAVAVITVVLSGVSFLFAQTSSWVPPTSAPPGANTEPPINVGYFRQIKNGGIGIQMMPSSQGYTASVTVGNWQYTSGFGLDSNAPIASNGLLTYFLRATGKVQFTGIPTLSNVPVAQQKTLCLDNITKEVMFCSGTTTTGGGTGTGQATSSTAPSIVFSELTVGGKPETITQYDFHATRQGVITPTIANTIVDFKYKATNADYCWTDTTGDEQFTGNMTAPESRVRASFQSDPYITVGCVNKATGRVTTKILYIVFSDLDYSRDLMNSFDTPNKIYRNTYQLAIKNMTDEHGYGLPGDTYCRRTAYANAKRNDGSGGSRIVLNPIVELNYLPGGATLSFCGNSYCNNADGGNAEQKEAVFDAMWMRDVLVDYDHNNVPSDATWTNWAIERLPAVYKVSNTTWIPSNGGGMKRGYAELNSLTFDLQCYNKNHPIYNSPSRPVDAHFKVFSW